MTEATESQRALRMLSDAAVNTAVSMLNSMSGPAELQRAALLDGVPAVIEFFSEGSAALAADFYDESRAASGVAPDGFSSSLVIVDRAVKIRRGVAWASEPLFDDAREVSASRLAEVVGSEVSRPYRDTITGNRKRDPQSTGWRRVSSGGCAFCRMLAAKGAIYRDSTARFAAHDNCGCTAEPVFGPNDHGPEATVMQYVASKRRRTEKEKVALREYLELYAD